MDIRNEMMDKRNIMKKRRYWHEILKTAGSQSTQWDEFHFKIGILLNRFERPFPSLLKSSGDKLLFRIPILTFWVD